MKNNTDYKIQYKKTVLDNGVRVLTEKHPYTHAVSVGIWVNTGSRDEKKHHIGMAHLVEHLVFKGTKKRSAYQLAQIMESRGGDLNAFTTRENICFYATVLKKDLRLALDVLVDLTKNATFPIKEFDTEKGVIQQEISMCFDNHEEYIFDLFSEMVYKNNPMGWPILGTTESIDAIKRKDVIEFYKKFLKGENLIVSVVGNVDHNEVVEMVEQTLGRLPKKAPAQNRKKPKFHPFHQDFHREIEQTHILVGFNAPHLKDSLRFASFLVNTALGGGMTSILYQKIREKKGLAYSVYSTIANSMDSGLTLIYAGTDPDKRDQVKDIILSEIKKMRIDGFNKRLLQRYKTQLSGYLLLNDDDLESRMNSLCLNEMVFGAYRSTEDILRSIDETQVQEIHEFLDKYMTEDKMAIMTLGPNL